MWEKVVLTLTSNIPVPTLLNILYLEEQQQQQAPVSVNRTAGDHTEVRPKIIDHFVQ